MIPIISFVGKSGSGKTTLLEKLIPEITSRGKRVGLIKHTHHQVELDAEGKDTHRLRLAGAGPVAIASPNMFAVFAPLEAEISLDEITDQYFTLADIIFTEGFKRESAPQALVLGDADTPPDHLPENIFAVICDAPVQTHVPVFTREDVNPLADLIEKIFFKPVSRSEVRVWVDGEFIPMKPFVKAFVGQTVKGMIAALKGGRGAEKIHIKIGR